MVVFDEVPAPAVSERTLVPLVKAYALMRAPAPSWLLAVAARVPELRVQPHAVVEVVKVCAQAGAVSPELWRHCEYLARERFSFWSEDDVADLCRVFRSVGRQLGLSAALMADP